MNMTTELLTQTEPKKLDVVSRMEARAAEESKRADAEKIAALAQYGEIVRNPLAADEQVTASVLNTLGLSTADLRSDIAAVERERDLVSRQITDAQVDEQVQALTDELARYEGARQHVLSQLISNAHAPEQIVMKLAPFFGPDRMEHYAELHDDFFAVHEMIRGLSSQLDSPAAKQRRIDQELESVRAEHPRIFLGGKN
jgi:hypothetical protein